MHPRLLSTLVLIDPVVHTLPHSPENPGGLNYTRMSTFRRDIWPSRAAAAASFLKSPFYSSWDPRVFSLWTEFGLRDLPTAIYPSSPSNPDSATPGHSEPESPETPVTLTTPKHQEVFTYSRPNFTPLNPVTGLPAYSRATHPDLADSLAPELTHPFYRPESTSTFRNLPHLRPSTFFIFGSTSDVSPPEWREAAMQTTGVGVDGSGGTKERRVEHVVLEGVGHLVPMIAPDLCAAEAADWLSVEVKRWWEEEERWKRGWLGRTKKERMVVSEEWKRRIGGDPRGEKRKEKEKL